MQRPCPRTTWATRLCSARGHGRLLRWDGGPNGQLRLSHVVAGHRQRRFRQDDRSGPGRREESVGPIVVRLPATAGLTLRPAGAPGRRKSRMENKAVTWDVFPAARCYQKTAVAMSAAMWGGNEPN